ncbi:MULTISPECIES: cupin domain-containing protein [Peribacillus]|uniref:cupin domain-containing protein n=1 Tax=Peribacillus TaxID=2675229 RepID=UPI00203B704D|nr:MULTISPECIES: cupin domain-containing protein [Peribacillus]MCM3672395.1 cupin domain-containing protein [Peribacillus simplex]MDQ0881637.1 quercetin dioxygenase-like cupin family protein [Peribacillus sp. V2I11]
MTIVNENEREYRFGDSGPKYLLKGPRMNFGIVVLKPRQDFPAHYHNIMEENFFILEGELEIHIDNEVFTCKKGDFIHVEPKKVHYLINKGNTDFKAAFMLSPYQEKDKVEVDYKPTV